MIRTLATTLLMALAVSPTAGAGSFDYLHFIVNGSDQCYSANGLRITYGDGDATVTTAENITHVLTLSDVSEMYFSEDASTALTGDVNGDGLVTIADANAIISIVLNGEDSTDAGTLALADVNGDGLITIADANAVIGIILGN